MCIFLKTFLMWNFIDAKNSMSDNKVKLQTSQRQQLSMLLEVTAHPSSLHLPSQHLLPVLPHSLAASCAQMIPGMSQSQNVHICIPSIWNPFPQSHGLLHNDLIYLNLMFLLCLKIQSPYIWSTLPFPDLVFPLAIITHTLSHIHIYVRTHIEL